MARVRVPLIACLTIMTIAGCSRHDPVAADAKPVNIALPANAAEPDPLGGPPEKKVDPHQSKPLAASSVKIPARLQGRWGLEPADCTSQRGDAKGLLLIEPDGLAFYESRAVPTSDVETGDGSINGHFDFTGEGQSWTKFEALKRNGDKLTRTETNPAASYTYAKC
jgi:hypothetical protein